MTRNVDESAFLFDSFAAKYNLCIHYLGVEGMAVSIIWNELVLFTYFLLCASTPPTSRTSSCGRCQTPQCQGQHEHDSTTEGAGKGATSTGNLWSMNGWGRVKSSVLGNWGEALQWKTERSELISHLSARNSLYTKSHGRLSYQPPDDSAACSHDPTFFLQSCILCFKTLFLHTLTLL